jgi:hypothetical protein
MGLILPLVARLSMDLQIVSMTSKKSNYPAFVIDSYSSLQNVLNQEVTFVTAEKMTGSDGCNWTNKGNNL